MKQRIPRRVFTAEFKCEAIKLVTVQVHRCRYQAREDLVNWIEGYYNAKRMHSALNYQSPVQSERELRAA